MRCRFEILVLDCFIVFFPLVELDVSLETYDGNTGGQSNFEPFVIDFGMVQ